jgi:pimeloyl-ACP methyl ester carboxylesterase
LAPQQPLASARWILGAGVASIGLAMLCVYLTFCLLFWQGQWQLVFKPSPAITSTPSSVGLKYDEIQFDATETGILQLNGWWIPADQPSTQTLLLLHGNSGNLSGTLPQLQILHQLGMNIFAFDYRGFGKSRNLHPSEKSTYEDADAAWSYLTGTRHLSASTIVLDGVGLGAAIAAETARRHSQTPALILEDPQPPILDTLQWDSLTRLLPIRLLFHDRFDPTQTLAQLRTPKLLLYPANDATARYYDQAADPKQKANLAAADVLPVLTSFLAKYLSRGQALISLPNH